MSNRIKIALCWLVFCLNNTVLAKIITTYSINSSTVQEIEKWVDKDTVVFIELDDTILIPQAKMFAYYDNPYRFFVHNMINFSQRIPGYKSIVAKWYQQRKLKLVEEGWVDFINRLKSKGVVVYGFCTMPVQLQNIEKKRYLEAIALGINFTDKVNNKEVLEIAKQEGWSSVFYKGIIFIGPFSKSQTILDFMRITNISPRKIVVFDSVQYVLKRIEDSLKIFDMDYYNIIYLGAQELPDRPNPDIVKFQQRELIERGIWVEDEEAASQLKAEK